MISDLHTYSVDTDTKLQFLKKLINAGADTDMVVIGTKNLVYANGDTPMHAAASLGSLDIIRFLLLYNPDVNRVNSLKQTASDYAKMKGYDDIEKEILFHIRKNIYQYFYHKLL